MKIYLTSPDDMNFRGRRVHGFANVSGVDCDIAANDYIVTRRMITITISVISQIVFALTTTSFSFIHSLKLVILQFEVPPAHVPSSRTQHIEPFER